MRSLEQVNIRTNVRTYVRTYVLTYIRTGQTLYPLHNFVVRGDNNVTCTGSWCLLSYHKSMDVLTVFLSIICQLSAGKISCSAELSMKKI